MVVVVSQHALQVVSQHVLQVSGGVVSQHALQVSRPTPRGVSKPTPRAEGGLQAHTWRGYPSMHALRQTPPSRRLLLRAVRILLEGILVFSYNFVHLVKKLLISFVNFYENRGQYDFLASSSP